MAHMPTSRRDYRNARNDMNTRDALDDMARALEEAEDRADSYLQEADTDHLTGLYNKRGMDRRTRSREWGWHVVADLNKFKQAQDEHPDGHAFGDSLLKEFSDYVRGQIRHTDVLGRTGGDEFTIWCETRAGAARISEIITSWVSDCGTVTASAGTGRSIDDADRAMYINKTTD